MAPNVVGPVTTILYSFWSVSMRLVRRITSAYMLSNGRNMMAKSVVKGGSTYLSWMSFAIFLIVFSNCLPDDSINAASPASNAS